MHIQDHLIEGLGLRNHSLALEPFHVNAGKSKPFFNLHDKNKHELGNSMVTEVIFWENKAISTFQFS